MENTKKHNAYFEAMVKEAENGKEFPSGANKAFWAWKYSEGEEVEVSESCWEREIADFISTFRKAGIQSFVITDQSTALMYNIHGFVANGCTMIGIATVTKKCYLGVEEKQGIRFIL